MCGDPTGFDSRACDPRSGYLRRVVRFVDDGQHPAIGATVDPEGGVLYAALGNAGQIGDYHRPPVIVTYALP